MLHNDPVESAIGETLVGFQVPGLVVATRQADGQVDVRAFGTDARGLTLAPTSLFPVASITKLATALAVLRLVDDGAFSLDEPLIDRVPEATASGAGVTVRQLLCHTSGLPLDPLSRLAPYGRGLDWPMLARACLATPLDAPPDGRVQYSNVGYGLLAVLVERRTGQPFATALGELVLDPLGIEGYLGVEPPRAPAVVADVRGPDAGTAIETFNSRFWRALALPWAGLITTAAGALALVDAFAGRPSDFLLAETRAEATRDQTHGLSGGFVAPLIWRPCPWGLGPDLRGAKRPHWAPAEASADSFGHSGASGCLAWSDLRAGFSWAILGSRTADNGWLIRRAPAIAATFLGVRADGEGHV